MKLTHQHLEGNEIICNPYPSVTNPMTTRFLPNLLPIPQKNCNFPSQTNNYRYPSPGFVAPSTGSYQSPSPVIPTVSSYPTPGYVIPSASTQYQQSAVLPSQSHITKYSPTASSQNSFSQAGPHKASVNPPKDVVELTNPDYPDYTEFTFVPNSAIQPRTLGTKELYQPLPSSKKREPKSFTPSEKLTVDDAKAFRIVASSQDEPNFIQSESHKAQPDGFRSKTEAKSNTFVEAKAHKTRVAQRTGKSASIESNSSNEIKFQPLPSTDEDTFSQSLQETERRKLSPKLFGKGILRSSK